MSLPDVNPVDEARRFISEAFAQINLLPHGTDEEATGLIEAQQHLAAARRALDTWQQHREELVIHPSAPRRLGALLSEDERTKLDVLLARVEAGLVELEDEDLSD